MRKAAGDEMTLWVEDEEVVKSSRKSNKAKKTIRNATTINSKNVIDINTGTVAGNDGKRARVQLTERDVAVLGWLAD